MVVRRRNVGTFVGPYFDSKRQATIRTVYILVPPVGADEIAVSFWEPLVLGIRSHMKNVNVQMTFLPPDGTLTYVQEFLRSATLAGEVAGIIPISCPRDVYRSIADSGLPTVILGTPYADQRDIASVDTDNYSTGRLLMEYLIGRGHRRIAMLTSITGRPGDNDCYDGVSDVLTTAGLPHNALVIRVVPPEAASVKAEMQNLLSMPNAPTAVIDWTSGKGRFVSDALASIDLPNAATCEVVFANYPATDRNPISLTYVRSNVSLAEAAKQIGEMLQRLGAGQPIEEPHVIMPVELCENTYHVTNRPSCTD
jgi:LacI family transcriptional regulator